MIAIFKICVKDNASKQEHLLAEISEATISELTSAATKSTSSKHLFKLQLYECNLWSFLDTKSKKKMEKNWKEEMFTLCQLQHI